MNRRKFQISALIAFLYFCMIPQSFADSNDNTLKREWNEIQHKYPNFSSIFIEQNKYLQDIIQQTRSQRLKKIIGSYTERSCALGLLPKCNAIPECIAIKEECDSILGDGLNRFNRNAWGNCINRYTRCISEFRLCC